MCSLCYINDVTGHFSISNSKECNSISGEERAFY